jgi:hypothetical protein
LEFVRKIQKMLWNGLETVSRKKDIVSKISLVFNKERINRKVGSFFILYDKDLNLWRSFYSIIKGKMFYVLQIEPGTNGLWVQQKC